MIMPELRRLYYLVTGKQLPRCTRRIRRSDPRRNQQYRAWIRTLDCLVPHCQFHPVHSAHTGSDGGTAYKASDWSCVPLCPIHHLAGYHVQGRVDFEECYGLDLAFEVRRLNAEYVSLVSLRRSA